MAIRNVRKDAKKSIDKDKDIPEDDADKLLDDLQKLTDDYCDKIQVLTDKKVKLLMET